MWDHWAAINATIARYRFIDLICTKTICLHKAIIVDSGIVETHISDHFLAFAALNLKMPKPLLMLSLGAISITILRV